jgi:serine/threonine-protein kinase RsbW
LYKRITISSSLHSVNVIEHFLCDIFNDIQISDKYFTKIFISLCEAVNNAIIHGNKLDENKSVVIRADFSGPEIVFEVEDEGCGFDIKCIKDPTLPENIMKESGRGIFLISKLSDSMSFDKNGKVIRIKFNILSGNSVS